MNQRTAKCCNCKTVVKYSHFDNLPAKSDIAFCGQEVVGKRVNYGVLICAKCAREYNPPLV